MCGSRMLGLALAIVLATATAGARAETPGNAAAQQALTERYLAFLAGAKTPRRALRGLADRARAAGARPLATAKPAAGNHYLWADDTDLALVTVGTQPLSAGARIIVTFVDPPAIELSPRPPEARSGVAVADLHVDDDLDRAAWLSFPLAIYVDWQGGGRDRSAAIGDEPGEPVFVIPDLLPHLSRKVQRRGAVDKDTRLDVLLAPSFESLRRGLAAHRIPRRALSGGRIFFAPATSPRRVGVGGALLSGYGHAPLAVTFAAADALLSAEKPPAHTAIVIATTRRSDGHAVRLVSRVMERLFAAGLAAEGPGDALALRRALARSAALVYAPGDGETDDGVILNFRRDDSLPSAERRVLRIAAEAKVDLQISQKRAWSGAVRTLSQSGMDAVGIALPVTGRGQPLSLLSTHDLFAGAMLCRAWLQASPPR